MNWRKLFGLLSAVPRLKYSESGRCGVIHYQDSRTSFDMSWEFGGGTTLVSIDVPTPAEWTARTGLPLEERDSVLSFVAGQVIRDKTSKPHHYRISDSWITIEEGSI